MSVLSLDKAELRRQVAKAAIKIGVSNAAKLYKISRVTVTKWVQNFKESGSDGLKNQSRTNQKHPSRIASEIVTAIIQLKKSEPALTAKKIIERLNLSCTTTTVSKIIRDHQEILTAEAAQCCYDLQIDKIETENNQANVLVIFKNCTTGIIYTALCSEKTDANLSVLADAFLAYLQRQNQDLSNLSIVSNLKYKERGEKRRLHLLQQTVCHKYGAKLRFGKIKPVHSFNFSGSWHFSQQNLLAALFYATLEYNLKLYRRSKQPVYSKQISYPVIADNYILKQNRSPLNYLFWQNEDKIAVQKLTGYYQQILFTANNRYTQGAYLEVIQLLQEELPVVVADADFVSIKMDLLFLQSRALEKIGSTLEAVEQLKHILAYDYHLNFPVWFSSKLLCGDYYLNKSDKEMAEKYYTLHAKESKVLCTAEHKIELQIRSALLIKSGLTESEVKKKLKAALFQAEKIGYQRGIMLAARHLCLLHSFFGSSKPTEYYYRLAKEKAEALGDRYEAFEIDCHYGGFCIQKKQMVLAEQILFSLQRESSLQLNNSQNCDLNACLANFYNQKGDYHKELELASLSLYQAQAIENTDKIIRALTIISVANWYLGKYNKALLYSLRCEKMCRKIGDIGKLSLMLGNITACYIALKRYDKAIYYCQISLSAAKKIKNERLICSCLNYFGSIYTEKGDYTAAIAVYQKMLILAGKIYYTQYKLYAYEGISECCRLSGDLKQALISTQKAFRIANQAQQSYFLSRVYFSRGRILFLQNKLKSALTDLKTALQFAQDNHDQGLLLELNEFCIESNINLSQN